MIHNSLLSSLFLPALLRVAGLLVAGMMVVAVAERRRLRRPRSLSQSTLCKRVLSWALMAPTYVLGVFVGGPAALLVVLLLIFQGIREFAALTGLHSRFRLLVGMSVALADVCAFVAGTIFHRPRLLPNISPNKTIAGVAGSVVGAYAAMALMLFAVPAAWPVPVVLAMPMLLAIASFWGDLLESLIKRTFAVKDAGTLLPGFGGILDRIDSLIVALPLAYAAVRFAG